MKTIFGIFPLFNNYTSVWQCMLANSKCISWRKDWNWWGFNSDTFYVLHYSAYYISIFKLQRTAFPGVWCNRVLFIPPAMFSSCIFKCILLTSAVCFIRTLVLQLLQDQQVCPMAVTFQLYSDTLFFKTFLSYCSPVHRFHVQNVLPRGSS